MNEIKYPMLLKYVPNWGEWEVVRELTANAYDTGCEYKVYKENNNLVFEDHGEGLSIRHLLFGESQKPSKNAIGQFGEGLKLALLVLTRMGKSVEIFTGDKYIINGKADIEGSEVFKLEWDTLNPPHEGTRIVIYDWKAPDYQDRFIFDDPNPDNVVAKTHNGKILWDRRLYVKGVYVNDLDDYAFGYDLTNINMNRDRAAVSEWDIQVNVGKIWGEIDDPEGWRTFFESAKEGSLERNLYMSNITEEAKDAMKMGFRLAFGNKAVLETNKEVSREAEHRKAISISADMFGYYLRDALLKVLPTDMAYVQEKVGEKAFTVPNSKLNAIQRKNLSIARRMAKKAGFFGDVVAAEMPEDVAGDGQSHLIRIDVKNLYDTDETKVTTIHELAHALYGTKDTTDDHVDACCKVAVRLITMA